MVARNVLALDDDPPLSQPLPALASHLCRDPGFLCCTMASLTLKMLADFLLQAGEPCGGSVG